MEASVQVNVRMSRSLKESGDEALALIGFSPTQAIRALWEKASRRGKDLDEVKTVLNFEGKSTEPASFVPDERLVAMWNRMDEVCKSLGIDGMPDYDRPSDEELLVEALYERMAERGLM